MAYPRSVGGGCVLCAVYCAALRRPRAYRRPSSAYIIGLCTASANFGISAESLCALGSAFISKPTLASTGGGFAVVVAVRAVAVRLLLYTHTHTGHIVLMLHVRFIENLIYDLIATVWRRTRK